jgi:hypothetical protein
MVIVRGGRGAGAAEEAPRYDDGGGGGDVKYGLDALEALMTSPVDASPELGVLCGEDLDSNDLLLVPPPCEELEWP